MGGYEFTHFTTSFNLKNEPISTRIISGGSRVGPVVESEPDVDISSIGPGGLSDGSMKRRNFLSTIDLRAVKAKQVVRKDPQKRPKNFGEIHRGLQWI